MLHINSAEIPTLGPELFKMASSHWASGVAVITTTGQDGQPHGLTMSAVMSLSLDPMQFLIAIKKDSDTLPVIKQCGAFCINFLNRSQSEIGMRFARKGADRFAGGIHHISDAGLPIITDALSSISCRIDRVLPGGDHEILIGNVTDIAHVGGDPLLHFNRTFHGVGAH